MVRIFRYYDVCFINWFELCKSHAVSKTISCFYLSYLLTETLRPVRKRRIKVPEEIEMLWR